MDHFWDEGSRLFKRDEDFLEAYSGICHDMLIRYNLSKHLRAGTLRREGGSISDETLRRQIAKLTEQIRVKEWLFWEKAEWSSNAGFPFVCNAVAAYYGLGHFEKRVFLLLLCCEFLRVEDFALTPQAILSVLDLEDSTAIRLKNASLCQNESPLMKLQVLKEDGFWSHKYVVNPEIVEFVSKRISGLEAELPKKPKNADPNLKESGASLAAPVQKFDQVVLDPAIKERIQFFLDVYQSQRLKELDIDKTLKNAQGMTFLFYGPPGTGKTMLAEAMAERVNKKILRVQTSKLFGPYLGETDKNISRLFEKAKQEDAVLLFDEADSLLLSREIDAGDSKLRFVNLLLIELERFEGMAILTTNMRDLLDKALERRISLKVEFKLPSADKREDLWRGHIPKNFLIAEDVCFKALAQRYEFAGGNIKNAVLNALRRVISKNENRITADDLIFGAELEKEGMSSSEIRPKIGF